MQSERSPLVQEDVRGNRPPPLETETPAGLRPLVEVEEGRENQSVQSERETPEELTPLVRAEDDRGADQPGHPIDPLKESTQPVPLRGPFRQSIWTWFLAVITILSLSCTIVLAWRSTDLARHLNRYPFEDPTAVLRTVRILAELNTLLLSALVAMSSRVLSWAVSSSARGISMPMWLAMSPMTSDFGLLKLLFWRHGTSLKSSSWHHVWIIIR
jgi:hypothetical protein